MNSIENIIAETSKESIASGIIRLQYLPYNIEYALRVVMRIAEGLVPGFIMTPEVAQMYKELIRYFHGDPTFSGDLRKGLILMGSTGSGKTLAMRVMQVYRQIDNIHYIKNNKPYKMQFEILHVDDVVRRFIAEGYGGVEEYERRYILCLDDIGAESERVKHFGNDIDIIGHIVSERCKPGLLTFATTNFPEETLAEAYNDRTVSRMHEMFNFLTIREKDFRRG